MVKADRCKPCCQGLQWSNHYNLLVYECILNILHGLKKSRMTKWRCWGSVSHRHSACTLYFHIWILIFLISLSSLCLFCFILFLWNPRFSAYLSATQFYLKELIPEAIPQSQTEINIKALHWAKFLTASYNSRVFNPPYNHHLSRISTINTTLLLESYLHPFSTILLTTLNVLLSINYSPIGLGRLISIPL